MGFKILLIVAMAAVGVALGAPENTREDLGINPKDGELIDWYSCEGKEIGNYANPRRCTHYITCDTGARVWERPCAACHEDPVRCPEGMLHYNEESDKCLWVDEAECHVDGSPRTTRRPPVSPTTTRPTAPTPTPEPECESPPPRPEPGWCNPDNCTVTGWCHWYDWCHRDDDSGLGADWNGHGKDGEWRDGSCSEQHNLYFNPDLNEYGGACDFWGNLPQKWKDAYHCDPECIDPHCEWKVDPDAPWCSPTYLYFNPQLYGGVEVKLACQSHNHDQLLWSQAQKNCLHCSQVDGENGNPCCQTVA